VYTEVVSRLCCDKQVLRGDAKLQERNLLLSLYREVTANADHPTQQAPPDVCIQSTRLCTYQLLSDVNMIRDSCFVCQ